MCIWLLATMFVKRSVNVYKFRVNVYEIKR